MRARYIYLILAFLLQFFTVWKLSLLSQPYPAIVSFCVIFIIGIFLYKSTRFNTGIRDLGWGLTFGSISLFILIVGLFLLLILGLFIEEANG